MCVRFLLRKWWFPILDEEKKKRKNKTVKGTGTAIYTPQHLCTSINPQLYSKWASNNCCIPARELGLIETFGLL